MKIVELRDDDATKPIAELDLPLSAVALGYKLSIPLHDETFTFIIVGVHHEILDGCILSSTIEVKRLPLG